MNRFPQNILLHIIVSCQVLKKAGLNPSKRDKVGSVAFLMAESMEFNWFHISLFVKISWLVYISMQSPRYSKFPHFCVLHGRCFGEENVLVRSMFWCG